MAKYHFHLDILGRSTGRLAIAKSAYTSGSSIKYVRSIVGSAAYRAAERIEDVAQDMAHDYSRKSGVVYSEIILPENAPEIFKDRQTLWNAVDQKENRHDSRLAREIDVTLPRELSRDEQIEIVREYATKSFVKEGMCADIAIHDKGDGNPHAHILLTVRDVDETGFIKHDKSRKEWNRTENMTKWRREWAEVNNKKFEEKGLDIRIDHRSYKEQGIDRIPTIHLGHEAHKMEQRGIKTKRGNINREITAKNLAKIKNEYIELSKKIDNATNKDMSASRRLKDITTRAENIIEYKEQFKSIEQTIDDLKNKHENIGFLDFKRKNELEINLKTFEERRNIIKNDFERRYSARIGEADTLINRLRNDWQDIKNNVTILRSQLINMRSKKDLSEYEYKSLKDTAIRHYFFDSSEIDNDLKLTELPESINERILIIQAEKQLNSTKDEELTFKRRFLP